MKLIRVATLSFGCAFAFATVALGQHGNWFEPIGASPNAIFESRETRSGKNTVPESQPMLQPGILQAPEQSSVKPWSTAKISTDTPRTVRKSWISVGPGSLPLATTIQPDATQKYGADPATLQVYFGHRR